ncbi:hypothetical protein ACWPKS_06830 [Coraliomargarita sp. W4R72]
MKHCNCIILGSLFTGFLLNGALSAQEVIIDNNFDTVDNGTYSGVTGDAFTVGASSANSQLGNASSKNEFAQVSLSGGVGNSRKFGNYNPTIRSRSTANISTGASFDFYFQFGGGSENFTSSQGFIGAGFALSAATDDSQVYNSLGTDRFLIGLSQRGIENDLSKVEFAGFGRLVDSSPLAGSPEITLTEGNWYNLSFDLSYTGANQWSIGDLKLIGYTGASDGTIASGESWSMSAITDYNPSFGGSVEAVTDAYAFISANKDRGVVTLDNILVTGIPEPSAYALLLSFTCLVVVAAGRKQQ